MSVGVERWKTVLAELTVQEKAELAHFLIDSIDSIDSMDSDGKEDTEVAWDEELARRVADIQKGQVQGRTAEQVFAALREKSS